MRLTRKIAETNVRRENFISTAKGYLGYTASADGSNYFGERVGYNGKGLPWDGAFIDVVARESGVPLTACVYTPVALSRFLRENRVYNKPQRGDIVFFETSTAARDFGPPHVGIVTDVSKFLTDGVFATIEAQTASGLPRASNIPDGVHQRLRTSTDVITFARPNFALTASPTAAAPDNLPIIKPAQVQPTLRHKSVLLLQDALTQVTGISGFNRGTMCAKTKATYAYFQRGVGYFPADGVPDFGTLQRLSNETQIFRVEA
jgi:hypothetical protein